MTKSTVAAFREYVQTMMHYEEAFALMQWDLRTGAPKKGHELRAEALGTIFGEIFRMKTSPEMESYLNELSSPEVYDSLSEVDRALVRVLKKDFDLNSKIPKDRFQAYVVLVGKAESVWADAKATSDFSMFEPYLRDIVAMKREFVDYWGYEDNKYDTLIDQYEPGMTVRQLDEIFGGLREKTVELVRAIVERGHKVDRTPFSQACEIDKQRTFNRMILEQMGYDFSAGRIDETVHPFATTINRYDVRVTTHYYLDDVLSALFSTIHEGGHALYEQGVSPELIGTPLSTGTSMGIHESQSRFWENMIGRSRAFWEANYPALQQTFPTQFGAVPLDHFYRGVNHVEPSLIRIESDEVTYNLHIMIRYEIEKGLINGTLEVKDLPEIWRAKMEDYLGITPPDDAHGVLQDVHWSGGDFGYFASYSLGNIYAAQFRNQMLKEIPDLDDVIRRGELHVIKSWLNERIHRVGRMESPSEIVRRVTGEEINSKYLVSYLQEKFTEIYQL